MEKEEIIYLLKESLEEIIPEIEGEDYSIHETLNNLGANSIDKGELITLTLEHLEIEASMVMFVKAESIAELADLILQHVNE